MIRKRIITGHVIFDLDGTLFDSFPGIIASIKHAFKENNLRVPDAAEIRIGWPLSKIMESIVGKDEELIRKLIKGYRAHYMMVGMKSTRLFPGVIETLKTLKEKGMVLGVASNKPESFARPLMDDLGITGFFDQVSLNRIEDEHEKFTKLQIMQKVQKGFGNVKPVMVGDTEVDIRTAKELQMYSVGVTYGMCSRDELLAEAPDAIIDGIEELEFVLG